jgi:pimeloyl-ACP methyl ester carboxylesterase
MKKWLKRLLIAIGALYLSICVGLYFYQEKLLFHPYTLPADFKYSFAGRYKEFNLDVGNGCMVNALHFYADTPAKGVVLYFHGNAEALDYTGTKAIKFTSRGYDCMMVDYPGYGKSTGALSEENLFNTGARFIDYTKQRYLSSHVVI